MNKHIEHAERAGVSVPCTAHHINFGGGCLNCGWTPDTMNAEKVTRTPVVSDYEMRALSVRCPLCWAAPQYPCFNDHGTKPNPHIARLDAYGRAIARAEGGQ